MEEPRMDQAREEHTTPSVTLASSTQGNSSTSTSREALGACIGFMR